MLNNEDNKILLSKIKFLKIMYFEIASLQKKAPLFPEEPCYTYKELNYLPNASAPPTISKISFVIEA